MNYSKETKDTKKIVRNLTRLKNKSEPILKKLKQPYTEIKIHNDNFYISKVEEDRNCLSGFYYDTNVALVCNEFKIIEENIKNYTDIIENLKDNYDKIKSNLGIELLKQDNKEFNKIILETEYKLDKLVNKYIDM